MASFQVNNVDSLSPSHAGACTPEQSCATTTALASIATAVVVGSISVMVHIAVCVYQCKCKKMKGQANITRNGDAVRSEVVYEEVPDNGEGGEVIKMEQNQAYSPPWVQ